MAPPAPSPETVRDARVGGSSPPGRSQRLSVNPGSSERAFHADKPDPVRGRPNPRAPLSDPSPSTPARISTRARRLPRQAGPDADRRPGRASRRRPRPAPAPLPKSPESSELDCARGYHRRFEPSSAVLCPLRPLEARTRGHAHPHPRARTKRNRYSLWTTFALRRPALLRGVARRVMRHAVTASPGVDG